VPVLMPRPVPHRPAARRACIGTAPASAYQTCPGPGSDASRSPGRGTFAPACHRAKAGSRRGPRHVPL